MKHVLRVCAGALLVALGLGSLLMTLHHPAVGAVLVAGGTTFVAGWRFGLASLLVAGGAWLIRPALLIGGDPPAVDLSRLRAGEYRAGSGDPLRLVTVRAVVRRGGTLIFATGHAPPGLGVDHDTLWKEAFHALKVQGVPPAPAEGSDPETAALFHRALARALSGRVPPQEPELPPGARRAGGRDTYWGMFPSEFAHVCDFSKVPDGRYEGTSSNPDWPATVRITVEGGRLRAVEVLDKRSSGHGDRAFERLPDQMVEQNRADVDIVTGATRSSLILRSAVWHACQAALPLD